jgi:hypothetical protein
MQTQCQTCAHDKQPHPSIQTQWKRPSWPGNWGTGTTISLQDDRRDTTAARQSNSPCELGLMPPIGSWPGRGQNSPESGIRPVLMASGERAIIRNSLFRLILRLFHAPRTIMRHGQGARRRSRVAARDVRYRLVRTAPTREMGRREVARSGVMATHEMRANPHGSLASAVKAK